MTARDLRSGTIAEGPTGRATELDSNPRPGWLLAALGVGGLVIAVALHPTAARSAAAQDWPPFVLVAGLLLIGFVADDDGLFAAGSLAWFLWLRAARTAGTRPSIAKAGRLGAVAVPLSMAAALGLLALMGSR